MPKILNPKIYEKAKKIADEKYEKPSAYKSGFIVKTYKELGGKYGDDKEEKKLSRWFKEEWKDVGNEEYPVYRPTKKVSDKTPLTPDEIKPSNLKEQIKLKQKIKGDKNLPKFIGSGIEKYSNPDKVFKLAKELYGDDVEIKLSTKKDKKYMILNPNNNKWVHFGQMGYEDYTKHNDKDRRDNFLLRNKKWENKPEYSPAFLSYHLLW